MIRKELDPFDSDDKFAKAGRAAEEQMAFYLKRFFDRKPDIHVLNNIRLERDGDAAQMDHLILHPYGIIVIESKSVQGKIQIKDDGQWIRWYGEKQSRGMASPITQAKLQVAFLKTTLGLAAGDESIFDQVPFDTIIAISDNGVILWPKSGSLNDVCKADQVAERVGELVAKLSAVRKGVPILAPGNVEKIVQYLVATHKPLQPHSEAVETEVTLAPTKLAETPAIEQARQCKHCGSTNLEIRYAHNYFFFCRDCTKNMPLKPEACPICGEQERVRKKANDFFFDCKKCESTRPFFTNAPIASAT